jgi:hypothetical protein
MTSMQRLFRCFLFISAEENLSVSVLIIAIFGGFYCIIVMCWFELKIGRIVLFQFQQVLLLYYLENNKL